MSRGFRVWDETKKQYDEIHTYFLSQEGTLWSWSTLLDDERLQGLPENLFIVEFDTGLKDKNGKKIYVGDIVEYDWYIIGDKPAYRVKEQVVFDDMGARVGNDRIRNCSNVEVIGNVHQNKELLND